MDSCGSGGDTQRRSEKRNVEDGKCEIEDEGWISGDVIGSRAQSRSQKQLRLSSHFRPR